MVIKSMFVLSLLISISSSATEKLPDHGFSLPEIKLFQSTFVDVKTVYGQAKIVDTYKNGYKSTCYFSKDGTRLLFASDPRWPDKITRISLAAKSLPPGERERDCARAEKLNRSVTFQNGFGLSSPMDKFKQLLGNPKRDGKVFSFTSRASQGGDRYLLEVNVSPASQGQTEAVEAMLIQY